MKKKLLALFTCALIATMAMCFAGCSSEPTEEEQLNQYTSLESISNFQNQSGSLLQAMNTAANPSSPNYDLANDTYKDLKDICWAVSNEDENNVPGSCKALHEDYVDAANNISYAADSYLAATALYSQGLIADGNQQLTEASTYSSLATDALGNAGTELAKIQGNN